VGLRLSKEYITLLDVIKKERKKGYLILSRKKERLLDITRLQETYEYALLELVYCYDAVIAVLKVIEVEVDLGLIEDEDVTAVACRG